MMPASFPSSAGRIFVTRPPWREKDSLVTASRKGSSSSRSGAAETPPPMATAYGRSTFIRFVSPLAKYSTYCRQTARAVSSPASAA